MPGCQARTSLCAARPRLSSMSSGVARPAAAQEVCGGLGPTVAGEGALLVPVHAADPGRRREVGEVPNVLADFATTSGVRRVDGNKKGAFTRDRRPKAAAHLLRRRWTRDA